MINLLLFIPCSIDLQKERGTQEEQEKVQKKKNKKGQSYTMSFFY